MFYENMKDLAEHKLILLYILDKIDIPMNNSEITQFVLENNYMNYFLIQQYLSELIESKFIKIIIVNGKECYRVSKLGKDTLNYFINRIPNSLKKKIDNKYKKRKEDLIKESQITATYFKKDESQYIVNLKVIENNITLFNLSLNVVSNKQAKKICENWKRKPDFIYERIIDLLINETINE